jgi:hypothetical protein
MTRPPLEVADIVRAQGNRFIHNSCRWIHWSHRKVLQAIARCRTAALGGHRDQCPRCGYRAISFNSCRNRHCPKCQSGARDQWIAARQRELLPVPYVHVVFTLPHYLSQLALVNKKVICQLLFRATAETLLEVAADPKHLGAQIGFFAVLHSWGQNLLFHPHIHCVIPSGGLSPDGTRWIHPRYHFFLPEGVLPSHFPLERLCPREPEKDDDPVGTGVLAPFPAPCPAPLRLRSHPLPRISGQLRRGQTSSPLSVSAAGPSQTTTSGNCPFFSIPASYLPLSQLRHPHDRRGKAVSLYPLATKLKEPRA